MANRVSVGSKAPEFTLFNDENKELSLKDFEGKNVLILFFPLSFTGVCTSELCTMRDHLSEYNELNAEVLAISVDSTFTLARYKKDNQFNFHLLSDFNKEVSSAYGCLYDTFVFGMKGVSKRSAFIIDKQGVIRYAEVLENAGELPNFALIKECLSKLN